MLSHKKEDVKYAQCLFIGKRQQQAPTTVSNQHPPSEKIYKRTTKLWELHLISLIFSVCVIFNNNWQSKKKGKMDRGEFMGSCNGRRQKQNIKILIHQKLCFYIYDRWRLNKTKQKRTKNFPQNFSFFLCMEEHFVMRMLHNEMLQKIINMIFFIYMKRYPEMLLSS